MDERARRKLWLYLRSYGPWAIALVATDGVMRPASLGIGLAVPLGIGLAICILLVLWLEWRRKSS